MGFESVWLGLVSFLSDGLTGASWWQVLLAGLAFTHLTIVSVTLYLHLSLIHI